MMNNFMNPQGYEHLESQA